MKPRILLAKPKELVAYPLELHPTFIINFMVYKSMSLNKSTNLNTWPVIGIKATIHCTLMLNDAN